jgi:hypothetical protein
MIVEIKVPPMTAMAIAYRFANEGYIEMDEAFDLLRIQLHQCGHQIVDYLLTCESEEIRRMARAYDVLKHGA